MTAALAPAAVTTARLEEHGDDAPGRGLIERGTRHKMLRVPLRQARELSRALGRPPSTLIVVAEVDDVDVTHGGQATPGRQPSSARFLPAGARYSCCPVVSRRKPRATLPRTADGAPDKSLSNNCCTLDL